MKPGESVIEAPIPRPPMTKKKPAPSASAWISGGEDHRPRHTARVKSVQDQGTKGGRPKVFEEDTARLNLMLPASLVRAIKIKAMDEQKTPGVVVTEILQKHFK